MPAVVAGVLMAGTYVKLWARRKWRAIDSETKRNLGFTFNDSAEAVSYYEGTGATVLKTNRITRTITVHIPQEQNMAGHITPHQIPKWLTLTK